MITSILVAASLVLAATPTRPEAMVVVSKRSGLARGPSLELARAFSESLKSAGVPIPFEVEELACRGKVSCLVEAARKRGAAVLIAIEVGSVLGDVVLHTEALSIDEDGRKLSAWDDEGPLATVKEKFSGLSSAFAPAIVTALGLDASVAETPSVSEAPPVAPPPAPEWVEPPKLVIDAAPRAAPGWSNPRRVGMVMMGFGAAGLAASGVLGGLTLQTVSQRNALCPGTCTQTKAFELDRSARALQTGGIASAIGGGLVAVAGLVLFAAHVNEDTTLVANVRADGLAVSLGGSF